MHCFVIIGFITQTHARTHALFFSFVYFLLYCPPPPWLLHWRTHDNRNGRRTSIPACQNWSKTVIWQFPWEREKWRTALSWVTLDTWLTLWTRCELRVWGVSLWRWCYKYTCPRRVFFERGWRWRGRNRGWWGRWEGRGMWRRLVTMEDVLLTLSSSSSPSSLGHTWWCHVGVFCVSQRGVAQWLPEVLSAISPRLSCASPATFAYALFKSEVTRLMLNVFSPLICLFTFFLKIVVSASIFFLFVSLLFLPFFFLFNLFCGSFFPCSHLLTFCSNSRSWLCSAFLY